MGLAAVAFTLIGCIDDFDHPKGYGGPPGGPDCAALCAESATCSDGEEEDDCRQQCDELERIVRAADCERTLDDLLGCYTRADSLCSLPDECADDANDLSACVTTYCELHGCTL
jgi:hypothetical protein